MYKDIEKLLSDLTPEEIYAEAIRIEEAKQAAAAKKNDVEIKKAREGVVEAFNVYTKALVGEEIPDYLKKQLEEIFANYEKVVDDLNKTKASTKAESKGAGSTLTTDDDTLKKFLKDFGLM